MENFVNKLEKDTLLRSTLLLIIGILALLIPNLLFHSIIYLTVGYLGFIGIHSLYLAVRNKKNEQAFLFLSIYGALLCLAALFVFLYKIELASFISVLLGLIVSVNGILDIISSFSSSIDPTNKKYLLSFGIIVLIIGLFIIANPFGTLLMLFRFFGIALVFISVSSLLLFSKKETKSIE